MTSEANNERFREIEALLNIYQLDIESAQREVIGLEEKVSLLLDERRELIERILNANRS